MGKKEQLIEFIIKDMVVYITENEEVEFDEAMRIVYNSETFTKLQDVETGLYVESSSYVYELLKDELEHGGFIQKEF
ncbi:MAG: hypothetical protein R3Y47_06220 [Lachnospiraceae bacterium]